MRRLPVLVLGSVLLAAFGCAGDPDFGSHAEPVLEGELERVLWERAEAGCEASSIHRPRLFGCEGEPSLGALVDADGNVGCVDAMTLLVAEWPAGASDADASERSEAERSSAADAADALPHFEDPTPTPTTPLPFTQEPLFGDPVPTPVVRE